MNTFNFGNSGVSWADVVPFATFIQRADCNEWQNGGTTPAHDMAKPQKPKLHTRLRLRKPKDHNYCALFANRSGICIYHQVWNYDS
jgi:hypothetical protein